MDAAERVTIAKTRSLCYYSIMAEITPEIAQINDTPAARVIQAAGEIAQVFHEVSTEDRLILVRTVAEELKASQMTVIDLHDAHRAFGDFNPDALPEKTGEKTGRTRAEVLGQISAGQRRGLRRRR